MNMSEGEKRGPKPDFEVTEEVIQKIREMSGLMTQQQMYHYFGISKDVWYDRKKKYPEMAEAIKQNEAKTIFEVASSLMDDIKSGGKIGVIAKIFFLKTKGGWSEKKKLKISSDNKTKIELPENLGSDPIDAARTYQKIMGG